MIHFLAGFLAAALLAGAFGLIGYRRLVRSLRLVAKPGEEVYFYDPTRTILRLAMMVEQIDYGFGKPSTMALVDKSTYMTRNRIPKGFFL